jgi:hypothetical protein
MKRFAVTGFAILYAVMVFGISASRTSDWVKANAPGHRSDQSSLDKIGKPEPYNPPFGRKRIPQNPFVVESPLSSTGTRLISDPYIALPSDIRVQGHSELSIPSRAPPPVV